MGYAGLTGASGGFFYDARVVQGLRETGVVVDNIELPWLGFGYARGLAANALPLPSLRKRSSATATDGYDLILQDEIVHPSMCWRNRRLNARGLPVVSIVHNLTCMAPNVRRPELARRVERAYLQTLSGIITVCESTRQDIRTLNAGNTPIFVARAGRDHVAADINDAEIDSRAHDGGPLRVLFVGTVSPHKGLHRLLTTIASMPAAATTLDVAGSLTQSPDYAQQVQAQASAVPGLTVTWHGEVTQTALHDLYRASHIFALPSDREAYSLAALDAMAFGLPVLLPMSGGSSEMIRDGVEGRLLDADNSHEWTAALLEFARDRDRLSTQGRAARSRHAAHGTWADTAAGVLQFLSKF